jgi:hypothetical protein
LRDPFEDSLLWRDGRGMGSTARVLAILKELQMAMDTISGASARPRSLIRLPVVMCFALVFRAPSLACFRRY